MPHLKSIARKDSHRDDGRFPFNVASVRTLPVLELSPAVTLLVGENGSGKSAARSHGEAFLDLFRGRFAPGGLYLLDEPEAALSPQSQLGLLAMLLDMVKQNAQFVIATHSPLLLAYPRAVIYSFDRTPVARVAYDDLDHVRLTREFLQDPERFLRLLG